MSLQFGKPLLFSFALEYVIRKVQDNNKGLKSNGTLKRPVDAIGVNLLDEKINNMEKNT